MALPCNEQEISLRQPGSDKTYFGRVIQHLSRSTFLIGSMELHSKAVANRIHAGGFDIVFANTCSQFYAPFLGRYLESPKLLYLQEPNRFLYEALPTLPWLGAPEGSSWRRRLRSSIDLFALRRQAKAELENAKQFDRILVNSYFSREAVARAYGLDSKVCYLGIDTDHFSPLSVARQDFVLGVGAIVPSKRVDLAIRSFAAAKLNSTRFVWAGNYTDEQYLQQLRSLATSLGVQVEFKFLVSDAELLDLMRSASCVLYVPKLEPFGYVPLEAAACGTPVVTVNEGGLRESMASGYGYLADPNLESIGERIRWVLDHQTETISQVNAIRPALVKKWNLKAGIERLETHMHQVISSQ
jgi:glycosyltransferase involved in cell wall biosynthesis